MGMQCTDWKVSAQTAQPNKEQEKLLGKLGGCAGCFEIFGDDGDRCREGE